MINSYFETIMDDVQCQGQSRKTSHIVKKTSCKFARLVVPLLYSKYSRLVFAKQDSKLELTYISLGNP